MYKLVRTDQDSHPTTLSAGLHVFGRGVFLDCKDKRVSHCHGQLSVGEDNKVVLMALHKNPCFVTVKDSPGLIVLIKGMTRELNAGDEFGLLPKAYWYKLTENEGDDDEGEDGAEQKSSAICEERIEAVVGDNPGTPPQAGNVLLIAIENDNVEMERDDVEMKRDDVEMKRDDAGMERDQCPGSVSSHDMSKQDSSPTHTKRSHSAELQSEPSSSRAKQLRLSPESLHIVGDTLSEKIKLSCSFEETDPLIPKSHGESEDDRIFDDGALNDSGDGTWKAPAPRDGKQVRGATGDTMPAKISRTASRGGTRRGAETMKGDQDEPLAGNEEVRQLQLGAPLVEKNPFKQARKISIAVGSAGVRVGQVSAAGGPLPMQLPDLAPELGASTSRSANQNLSSVPAALHEAGNPGGILRVRHQEQALQTRSPGRHVKWQPGLEDPEDFWNVEDLPLDAAFAGLSSDDRATPMKEGALAVAEESVATADVGVKDVGPELDSGSEYDDTDDEEWPLQSRVDNAVLMSDRSEDIEPELAELMSAVSKIQDEADDQLLSSAAGSTFTWSSDYSEFTGSQEVFTETPGPTSLLDTPYENFCQIWTPDIMDTIAEETNRYAWQTIVEKSESQGIHEESRIHNWVDTNRDELYVLFAIFMLMAIDPRSRLEEYWMRNSIMEMPRFRKVMSFNRYLLLTRFLHFVDNYSLQQRGGDRKVAKIQRIIDHCNSKFQSCYVPHQYVAVDESLLLWKGGLSWVQSIMTKAARWGIKTYELCESHTGYLWKFRVYTGKSSDVSSNYTGLHPDLTGKTSAIVLDMVEDLHHKGYCLTMDNFYNSPALARHLKTLGIDCIGTLRISRKNVPDDLKRINAKTMVRGAIESRHCGDVSVQSWNDARLVTTISTYHTDGTYEGKRGNRLQTKPLVIRDYNKAMGGVDLKDQKLSMYPLERKRTHKWYIKLFKRLLNVSILNSLVMHHYTKLNKGQRPISHRKFRHDLANQLIEKHHTFPEVRAAPFSVDEDRLDGRGHVMYTIVKMCDGCESLDPTMRDCDKCTECKHLRRRCARCFALGRKRRETRFYCQKCDKPLCVGRCFLEYHSMKDLSKGPTQG